MRLFIAIFSACFISSAARAVTIQVSPGQYDVFGPFIPFDIGPNFLGFVEGGVSFSILGGGDPLPGLNYDPLVGPFFGYDLSVGANEAFIEGCAFSQLDSLCGRFLTNQPEFQVVETTPGKGELSISDDVQLTNVTPLDLAVFVTLPDGFTIENVAAVPELSTWAMLLIGFVGIGFTRLGYARNA